MRIKAANTKYKDRGCIFFIFITILILCISIILPWTILLKAGIATGLIILAIILRIILPAISNFGNLLGPLANILGVLPLAVKSIINLPKKQWKTLKEDHTSVPEILKDIKDININIKGPSVADKDSNALMPPKKVLDFYIIHHQSDEDIAKQVVEDALKEKYECTSMCVCWSKPEDFWQMVVDGSKEAHYILFILSETLMCELDEAEIHVEGKLVKGEGIWEEKLQQVANANDSERQGIAVFLSNSLRIRQLREKSIVYFTLYEQLEKKDIIAAKNQVQTRVSSKYCPLKNLLPTSVNRKPIWTVPNWHPDPYIERTGTNELTVVSLLAPFANGTTSLQVLWGLNGVGKTRIALEYANSYGRSKIYHCVLWVDGSKTCEEGFERLNGELKKIELQLDDVQVDMPELGAGPEISKFRNWLSLYETKFPDAKWLLIVDKCTKENFEILRRELPSSISGHVLFTMREMPRGISFAHHVEGMSGTDGILLFMRKAEGKPNLKIADIHKEIKSDAKKVVSRLDGNPLMLYNAGAYIAGRLTPKDFLERYEAGLKEILSRPLEHDYENESLITLAATWSVTFADIDEYGYDAKEVLLLCAYLEYTPSPVPIPISIIEHMLRQKFSYSFDTIKFNLDKALERLYALAAIKSYERGKTIILEKILRDIIHTGLDATVKEIDEATKIERKMTAIRAVNAAFPRLNLDERDERILYLPHVSKCVAYILDRGKPLPVTLEAIQLLHDVGLYLRDYPQYEDGKYLQTKMLLEEALQMRAEMPGPKYPDLSLCHHSVAEYYHERFLYEGEDSTALNKAQEHYKKALTSFSEYPQQTAFTTNLRETAFHNDLGRLYEDKGGIQKAQEEFEDGLKKCEAVLNIQRDSIVEVTLRLDKVAILNNLALLTTKDANDKCLQRSEKDTLLKYVQARNHYERAEQELGKIEPYLNNLPSNYKQKELRSHYHDYRQQQYMNLSLLYACWNTSDKQKDFLDIFEQHAYRAFEESIEAKVNALGQSRPHISGKISIQLLTRLNNLAQLLLLSSQWQGKEKQKAALSKAESYYMDALRYYLHYAQERSAKKKHPLIDIIWGNLKEMSRDPKNRGFYQDCANQLGLKLLDE